MVIHLENYQKYEGVVLGGKANSLLELSLNGINVPKWCVIPENYPQKKLIEKLGDISDLNEQKAKILITDLEIEPLVLDTINNLFDKDVTYFSVRSSASDEDGAGASFAGQYETFLFVKREEIAQKIKKVWLSAFSEHLTTYREQNKLNKNFFLSVIVQEMVDADVSGIAFGANPISGNREEKVISAVYGLGEGIVSGELNADNFTVCKGKITHKKKALKDRALKYINGQLSYVEVEQGKRNKYTLSDEQVLEVATTLDKLKQKFFHYQDVEFSYAKGELFLLQSRPITSLNRIPDKSNNFQIWDNSNIVESYPGQSSPLTFAFILKVYKAVYIQFCELMGVDKTKIKDNDVVFSNMLGLINGKVYYNLLNWYRVLSLFPGYSVNKEFMQKMMGVKEPIDDSVELINNDSRFKSKLKVAGAVFKILNEFYKLKKDRERFLKYINKVIEKYDKIDYAIKSPYDTMNDYIIYEEVLLKKWRAPLINDFFAMIFFGILQKQCEKYAPDEVNIANDLLIGSNDIVSVELIKQIQAILTEVRKDEVTYNLFKSKEPKAIFVALPTTNQAVDNKVKQYLFKFGDRCTGELKLETKTYNTEPLEFVSLLKAQLDVELNIENLTKNGKIKRQEAEELLQGKLKGKFIKQKLFNFVLRKTRDLVSNRENLRFERTRAFGVVRKMFNGLGKQFYAEGIIEKYEDIFYLTQEEIFSYIRGTSVNLSIKKLIELRKKDYQKGQEVSIDDRFETYGVTYVGNSFKSENRIVDSNSDLKGIGCSSGIVEEEVIVVHSPKEKQNLEGKILVCESTDPGWVTLFPTCSAIIVERGSLLSHSAIVSREMGIPCIVSVSNLLQMLKTGDRIRMNGTTGEIDIEKKAKTE